MLPRPSYVDTHMQHRRRTDRFPEPMGESSCIRCIRLEVLYCVSRVAMCIPRPHYFLLPRDQVSTINGLMLLDCLLTKLHRRLTIEEVSVIFDTGRLGNANAAAAEFQTDQKHASEPGSDTNAAEKGGVTTLDQKSIPDWGLSITAWGYSALARAWSVWRPGTSDWLGRLHLW